jgi:hypothetical protein
MEASAIRDYKPAFPLPEKRSASEHPILPTSTDTLPINVRRPNPYRKYTRKWFGHAWDTAVEAGRWPRVTYLGIGTILISVWIGVMYVFFFFIVSSMLKSLVSIRLYFAHLEVVFQRKNASQTNLHGNSLSDIKGLVCAKGTLRKFDPAERSLSKYIKCRSHCPTLIYISGVSWSLVLIDEDDKGQQILRDLGTNENNTVAFNIYRDVKVVLEDRPLPTGLVNDPEDPLMRIDNTTQPPIAVLGTHPWDSVDTDIDFTQAQPDDVWKQPLFAYPYDTWTGSIVLAMTVREAAISANLSNGFAFQIADAMLADSTREYAFHLLDSQGLLLFHLE